MKFNFKKIVSVFTSTVMLGSTVALAAAANAPAPFVSGGVANAAVVVGSSTLAADDAAAQVIKAYLDSQVTSSSGSSVADDANAYKFEKSSQKLWLGSGLLDASKTTLNEDNFPELLADGKFVGSDNEEYDYTQKVNVANLTYSLFDDNDYKEDTPSVGIRVAGTNVLNYTLSFDDIVPFDKLVTQDLPMMGRSYYVLSKNAANDTITLLDSAETLLMSEGETKTVTVNGKTFEITVDFISSTPKVKFIVNGKATTLLANEQTEKIDNGYIGVKEVLYTAKESGVSKVEFAIGSGKLELISGYEIKMNDQVVTGITATITNSTTNLASIILQWDADGDQFVAADSDLIMPGFKALKLSYGGMVTPKSEKIVVENDGRDSIVLKAFPLKDGAADINILYSNETAYVGIGKESDKLLVTSNTTSLTFDADSDSYFVASYNDSNEGESYLLRASSFVTEDSTNKTTIQKYKNGAWEDVKTVKDGDEVSIGNVDLGINSVNRVGKSLGITANNSGVKFNTLYSAEGLKVYLPRLFSAVNYTATPVRADEIPSNDTATGYSALTTYNLRFQEEDKDGKVGSGKVFNVTLGLNDQSPKRVTVSTLDVTSSLYEVGSSDVDVGYVYSPLATQVSFDRSGDQDTVEVTYHGDESYGEFYLSDSGTVISGSSGILVVMDNEASKMSGKNLVVVGGSCINTVAATLLGSSTPLCGSAWESATGAGAGSFVINSYDYSGKIATLVAGYNQADTLNAANYFKTHTVDTSAGKKYKGTTATADALVVA